MDVLKGLCAGNIMTAIGRDSNDQMLAIALEIVEGEIKENLIWFMELLIDDIGGTSRWYTYKFIFDQQKVHLVLGHNYL